MKLDFVFRQGSFFTQPVVDEPASSTVSTRPRRDTPTPIKGANKHVLLRDAKPFQPDFKPNILRRETDGGICISIGLEWMSDCVMGRVFNSEAAPFRAISHQRAFVMAYTTHWAGVEDVPRSIKAMIGVDREITEKYIARFIRVDPIKFVSRSGLTLNGLAASIVALPLGRALLINLMGKTEGHAIAVAHGMSVYRYFDANQGQFSNEVAKGAQEFAEAVTDNIAMKYNNLMESIDVCEFYRG